MVILYTLMTLMRYQNVSLTFYSQKWAWNDYNDPKNILKKSSIISYNVCLKMLVPWIQVNVHVVLQLSIIDVWNQKSQENDNMFIIRAKFKIFWVIVVIQDFLVSLLYFLGWYHNSWEMLLHFLCQKVKEPFNGEIVIFLVKIIMWIKSIQTHIMTPTFHINVLSMTVFIKDQLIWYLPVKEYSKVNN